MSYSYTQTETTSFTATHAKHIAAKVATDLKRMQRLYGSPSDALIMKYEAEATEFLKAGFLGSVTYGFKRDGQWIEPTLGYTAADLAGGSATDDDPGRVRPGADVSGASFYSYLTYSRTWWQQSPAQQELFKKTLPFVRDVADEPGVNGLLQHDRTYSSGGRSLNRSSVRSY